MTAHERFEQDLPQLLAQLADGPRPDYRDALVEATARTSQRPAWMFPGRWLPMDITARRVTVGTVPIRPLALLLLVGLLVVTALAVVVGSQRRVPEPFGPAENGLLVYATDGDIWSSNPDGSNARVIISDEADSLAPILSRQGTQVAFVRPGGPNGSAAVVYVANLDGTGVRALTEPLIALKSGAWSPDGTTIAVAHEVGGYSVVDLVASDGSGFHRIKSDIALESPAWRPQHAGQLLVRGWDGEGWAFYLLDATDTELARLDLPHQGLDGGQYDFLEPDWSPDGTRLVYHTLEALSFTDNPGFRIHVADVDPVGKVTANARVEFDPLADDELSAGWLSTGDQIAFVRFKGCTDSVHVAAPAPGASEVAAREVNTSCVYEDRGMGYELAPDAGSLLTWPLGGSSRDVQWLSLVPGAVAPETYTVTVFEDMNWQRLAP